MWLMTMTALFAVVCVARIAFQGEPHRKHECHHDA
jgi:hypothetical protein